MLSIFDTLQSMEQRPYIGVAAIVRNPKGELLLGLHKSKHAQGTWGFPGGHLEFMETPEDCIAREVWEETGLRITKVKRADFTNDFYPETQKHYITLFYEVEYEAKEEPKVCEPDKCERWEWFSVDNLPDNMMRPITNLLSQGIKL